MIAKSAIFNSHDPLTEAAPLFIQQTDQTADAPLTLRLVWLIGDLQTLYDWFNSANKKTNWEMDANRQTVYQRYKNMLLSDQTQSFMITENDKPLIQFDLLASVDGLAVGTDKITGYLYFLFQENFRNPRLFARSLQFLLAYVFSFPEMQDIYLPLLNPDRTLFADLNALGFESTTEDSSAQELPIYRISRKA